MSQRFSAFQPVSVSLGFAGPPPPTGHTAIVRAPVWGSVLGVVALYPRGQGWTRQRSRLHGLPPLVELSLPERRYACLGLPGQMFYYWQACTLRASLKSDKWSSSPLCLAEAPSSVPDRISPDLYRHAARAEAGREGPQAVGLATRQARAASMV